ncbi:MAG TPA: alpha/beta hydrolase [Bryobacteraceae bacterium]|nr:alpha/beta hydrolase [Bryobacteraceae bacterium]
MTRRSMVGTVGAIAVQAQIKMGPPPHTKGPKVFLDYDQVELDAAYNQALYAPNAAEVQRRYARQSELTQSRLGAPVRAAYGPSEIEKLDIFRVAGRKAPVHLFIHGGAWRGGHANEMWFLADLFAGAGIVFIVPDFAPVQELGGRLPVMERQVRRAVQWAREHAEEFGGDASRMYVSGHSSGAHLLGATLTMLPPATVQGAMLISGMYDLRGPRLSSRSTYVRFDDQTEELLSPQRHIDKLRVPLIVAWGGLETPEFQRQGREFAAALKAQGKAVETIVGANYNHFELLETLATPNGILGRAALRMMKAG